MAWPGDRVIAQPSRREIIVSTRTRSPARLFSRIRGPNFHSFTINGTLNCQKFSSRRLSLGVTSLRVVNSSGDGFSSPGACELSAEGEIKTNSGEIALHPRASRRVEETQGNHKSKKRRKTASLLVTSFQGRWDQLPIRPLSRTKRPNEMANERINNWQLKTLARIFLSTLFYSTFLPLEPLPVVFSSNADNTIFPLLPLVLLPRRFVALFPVDGARERMQMHAFFFIYRGR